MEDNEYKRNLKGARTFRKYLEPPERDFWYGYINGLSQVQNKEPINARMKKIIFASENPRNRTAVEYALLGYNSGLSGETVTEALRNMPRFDVNEHAAERHDGKQKGGCRKSATYAQWLRRSYENFDLQHVRTFNKGRRLLIILTDREFAYIIPKKEFLLIKKQGVEGSSDEEIYRNMFKRLTFNRPEWIKKAEDLGLEYQWKIPEADFVDDSGLSGKETASDGKYND